jgi:hypothetical protein
MQASSGAQPLVAPPRSSPACSRRGLFHRVGGVVKLPHVADAYNESGNLAKRDSSPVTAIPDHWQ